MNFESDLIKITDDRENNILYMNVLIDEYSDHHSESIKHYFSTLFNYFNQNKPSGFYGFVFDISKLSSLHMYKYATQFKSFFNNHKDNLHKYIGCTAIIVQSTFIRVILAPIINLINKGRSLTFTKTIDEGTIIIKRNLVKLQDEYDSIDHSSDVASSDVASSDQNKMTELSTPIEGQPSSPIESDDLD